MGLLSTKEAAERLGVSERTVRRWIKAGKIRPAEWRTPPGGGKPTAYFSPEEIERVKRSDTIGHSGDDRTRSDSDRTRSDNLGSDRTNDRTRSDTPSAEALPEGLGNQGVAGRGEGGVSTSILKVETKVETSKGQKRAEVETSKVETRDPLPASPYKGEEASASKGEEILIEDGEVWLTVSQASELLQVSKQAVRKACQKGKYKTREVKTRGGTAYLIALTSLPPEAQRKWVSESPEEVLKRVPEEVRERLSVSAAVELVMRTAPKREIDPRILFNKKAKAKLARLVPALEEALKPENLRLPPGERGKLIERLAREAGINRQNFYRYLKLYREGGPMALVCLRRKGLSSWDPEAVQFLQGAYLKGIREAGSMTVRRAYAVLKAEAKKRGWRIGSERSAYQHIKAIDPLLIKYARGGARALSNVYYLARRYDDLHPFEIIVGDQHRFDFFVQDPETGRVFRPEGYFWLDLRTRLVYGFAVAGILELRNYNAYLMGVALRGGLTRFGKFAGCYTDNGLPERSRYFAQVADEMRLMGLRTHDISELYRTEDGRYVVEAEEGEVLSVVETVNAWRRFARPYNAKAKPIERFFQTLEGCLLDLGVPGHVKELGGDPEEKREAEKRLRDLAKAGKLLTPEEALLKIFEAVEVYNHRRHQALSKSPMEELQYAVSQEGFCPVMVAPEEALELTFMMRATRKVERGRIRLHKRLYEARELYGLPDGTSIEVRYDLYDPTNAVAVFYEREEAVDLELVRFLSMKGGPAVAEALRKKAEFVRRIVEKYRELTRPVPGVVEYSKVERVALKLRRKRREREARFEIPEKEFERLIAEAEARQKVLPENVIPLPVVNVRELPVEPVDRYAALLDIWERTGRVPVSEIAFMREFEARLSESERKYWDFMRKFKGLPPLGEFSKVKEKRAG